MAQSPLRIPTKLFINDLLFTWNGESSYEPTQDVLMVVTYLAPPDSAFAISIDGKTIYNVAAGAVQNVGYVSANKTTTHIYVAAGQTITFSSTNTSIANIKLYTLRGGNRKITPCIVAQVAA